jgi:hypothetical protein
LEDADSRGQFEEWLPWYVNGTLGAEDRAWMTGYLARNPDLQIEVVRLATMRDDMRAALEPATADVGWSRLRQRIAQEKRAAAPGLMERLRATLERFASPPAFALAAALVVVQFGVIGSLVMRHSHDADDFAAYRSLPGSGFGSGPILQVTFKQDATERAMRLLLVDIEGALVGGPGQIGTYFVAVPPARLDAALKRVGESPIVDSVSVVPAVPSKN